METKEQVLSLKKRLGEIVESKKSVTRKRLAYKAATPVSDPDRYGTLFRMWCEGSILKEEIRSVGLAYAFLRGRSYWVTERHAVQTIPIDYICSVLETVGAPQSKET